MPPAEQRRLTLAALLLAVSGLLSRLLAYARDAVIAWQLGAGPETDAYHAAFLLPDMLHYFLSGGALSITFIPLFSKAVLRGHEDRGWRLFSNVLTTLGGVLVLAVITAWFMAPRIVPLLFPGFDPEQLALTTRLTRLILPGPLLFFAGGLIIATELARQRFLAAALSPLLYNLCIILGGVLLGPAIGVEGFSWGVLAGALAGPVVLPLLMARRHLRYRPRVDTADPDLRRYLHLAFPLMVGVSLLTVDEWFGRYFGSQYAAGSITWLNNARRLMLVPVALVGTAVAQAALPFLSHLAAREEWDRLADQLRGTLRATATLATVAGGALFLVALPFTVFVYERGAFTAEDSRRTAEALSILSFAVVAWSIQTVAVRGFYAREDTWRPMWLGTAIVVASAPLYAWLGGLAEIRGLALATVIGMGASAVGTLWLYRVRHGTPLLGTTIRGLLDGAAATGPGMIAGWLAVRLWAELSSLPAGPTDALLRIVIAATAFTPVAVAILVVRGGAARSALIGALPRRYRHLLDDSKRRSTGEPADE